MLQAEQILHKRYQLQELLKSSFNRQTWLAVDLATSHQLVVIKLLLFNNLLQWEEHKLFDREAQVLKQMNHLQVPEFIDYFSIEIQSSDRQKYTFSSTDTTLWFCLVQKYIPGYSLRELLAQGKQFSEQQAKDIARSVLNILIYLHGLKPQLLHRDIKPSNIICGEDGQVYLVDFGTVNRLNQSTEETFTIVGSYGYTPIEQFSGKAVPASDLYALGATLIHLLTGIMPADLPQQNLQIQFPDIGLSLATRSWLSRLVEPAVEKRFATAKLALESLESGTVLPQLSIINNSGQGRLFDSTIPVPAEIKAWNWGAFLLSPLWLVSNRVWIGMLAWIPIVGFSMAIALGAKGNEWAWKSRHWQSIEQFQTHQRKWAIAGIIFGISVNLVVWNLGILYLLSTLI